MPETPDVRWRQRLQSLRKAFDQLSKANELATQRELSDLEKQGIIQAFEFTHELAWNVLKDFLESRGTLQLFGSKDATREAFSTGLIKSGDVWMNMIASRNQSSHTYNEATANAIAQAVTSSYVEEFRDLIGRLSDIEEQEEST